MLETKRPKVLVPVRHTDGAHYAVTGITMRKTAQAVVYFEKHPDGGSASNETLLLTVGPAAKVWAHEEPIAAALDHVLVHVDKLAAAAKALADAVNAIESGEEV